MMPNVDGRRELPRRRNSGSPTSENSENSVNANFREIVKSEVQLRRTPYRNCLKSPEGASNVASQGTEAALFGPFRPLYTGQIHVRSVAHTPFQTVSWRTSQNLPSTHSGEQSDHTSSCVIPLCTSLRCGA